MFGLGIQFGADKLTRKHAAEAVMNDEKILFTTKLSKEQSQQFDSHHTPSYLDPPPITELRVVRYDSDDEIYLLYCDDTGRELNDSLHESVDEAMEKAKQCYGVKREEWVPNI